MTDAALYAQYGTSPPAISAILRSALSLHHKAVLIALISRAQPRAGQGWRCWPSLDLIALDCSMSRAKVSRVITDLRKTGLVGVVPSDRRSTVYLLNMFELQVLNARQPGQATIADMKVYYKPHPAPKAT